MGLKKAVILNIELRNSFFRTSKFTEICQNAPWLAAGSFTIPCSMFCGLVLARNGKNDRINCRQEL
jgi:hypothetical protein